jgi:hypothetical protein
VAYWTSKWARIINNQTGSDYIGGGNTLGNSTTNKGLHEVRQNTYFSILNLSSVGVSGVKIFCRDTNNGKRLGPNKVATNYDYIPDRTYETTTDNNGTSSILASGGILIATTYQNSGGANISRFVDVNYDYRGLDNSNTDRFKFGFACYGYKPASYVSVLKGVGGTTVPYTMLLDDNVTATLGDVPSYSSLFSIDVSGNIIVTADATLDQLYDYAAYWLSLSGTNMEVVGLGNYLINGAGSTLTTNKIISLNPSTTLSDGTKFNVINTSALFGITGTMNVTSYVSPSGTFVKLGATGVISGSRAQFYNMTDNVEISNSIVNSSPSQYVEYVSDKLVRLRLSCVQGITGYDEYEQTGVLSSNGLSFVVTQTIDPVYNAIGIDGGTVTEFTADYPNIQIDISDPDQITSVQRLYSWYKFITFNSQQGIQDFYNGIMAEDYYNYKIDVDVVSMTLDNRNPEPVIIYGARLYRSDGTTVIASGSNSIQMDPDKAYLANSNFIIADLATIKKNTNLIPALL